MTAGNKRLTLPEADKVAKQHSDLLVESIRAQIQDNRGIAFSRYMELALYQPGLGYYGGGSSIFSSGGDFVTAPELTPLFAQALARQVGDILQTLPAAEVLEAGAGSGILAVGLLQALEKSERLPDRYRILELSAPLRARQQQAIERTIPHLADRVEWLEQLPAESFSGLILGNELLDAMPVDLFQMEQGVAKELLVTWDEGFALQLGEALPRELQQRLEPLQLADGYRSECNRRAEAWIATIGQFLKQGAILLIDYGFPRTEYYHPERSSGTLMCHYRQHAHADPFFLPGLQDITAHIEFTAMAEAAVGAGMSVAGFIPQAEFLINCGITEWVEEGSKVETQLTIANQLKKLLMPGEMGEMFKVIAFSKQLDLEWRGFSRGDQLYRL